VQEVFGAADQLVDVLYEVIAHNLCVLIACMYELGLAEPKFQTAC
jgi:hypothetical protein